MDLFRKWSRTKGEVDIYDDAAELPGLKYQLFMNNLNFENLHFDNSEKHFPKPVFCLPYVLNKRMYFFFGCLTFGMTTFLYLDVLRLSV